MPAFTRRRDLAITDVLMAAGKILAVGSNLTVSLPDLETVDAKGKILTPGFLISIFT